MLPWVLLDTAATPDGTPLTLNQRGTELVIRAGGRDLMSSRMHGSEEAMAALAKPDNRPDARILVGGLGMGFTLRAALGVLPAGGTCTVAELVPAVVDWNRGTLGPLAGHPLDDPRARLRIEDVRDVLRTTPDTWDSILLDVDNGPDAFTQPENDALYTLKGLQRARMALRRGGVLAVWSAYESPEFPKRLQKAGFRPESHRVRARAEGKGPRHVIYIGRI
ncbi:MAG: spermidine synthase [Pseudomonadota bacterium]|nr:spermidine synthase [Pseudomonadota bacterium]